MKLPRRRNFLLLFIFVFISTSLHSIPVGQLIKPFTKIFSKSAKEVVDQADNPVLRIGRDLSDDLLHTNKLNKKLFDPFSSDININYLYRLDEKFSSLDAKTQKAFLDVWKLHSSKNKDYITKTYRELTSVSKNETIDSFVIKLGKIEATLIAGVLGITFFSADTDAAEGGVVDLKELPTGIKPSQLNEGEYKKSLQALKCLQAYQIISIRNPMTYSRFQLNLSMCPEKKPDHEELVNYFETRIQR